MKSSRSCSFLNGNSKTNFTPLKNFWAKTDKEKPGTAGSQFFVTTGNPAALNGTKKGKTYDYGYFGHVTSGLDIAKKIESLAPPGEGGLPTTDVYILSVKITEQ